MTGYCQGNRLASSLHCGYTWWKEIDKHSSDVQTREQMARNMSGTSKKSQQQEKQHWAEEGQSFTMRESCEEFMMSTGATKNSMKHCKMRERTWRCIWTLQCRVYRERLPKRAKDQNDDHWQREIVGTDHTKGKIVHAYKCEAHELTRKGEDHIAGRGLNSKSDYNLVHKFIPTSVARIKS